MIKSFESKGCHHSRLPIFIIKFVADILSPYISDLFNSSMNIGIFPDSFKIGKVTPLHKSGNRKHVSNYRPISTLTCFSKIFEKLACNRFMSYIVKYKLLCKHQFGFQANNSTSDALLQFLDHAYGMLHNNECLITIFLDFSKAFDTVDHSILLQKLEHFGFRGNTHSWLKSYLTNRKQYVCMSGEESSLCDVSIGVPQGSTLGPLLFLMYINDMYRSSDIMQAIHFADDTTLYHGGSDLVQMEATVNAELVKVDEWLCSNRLSLNTGKSTYMIINNGSISSNIDLIIRNSSLKRVTRHKFLGVVIDSKLKFSDHVMMVAGRLSQSLGIMRRFSHIVSADAMRNLYFAFFYSHLTYAITAWGSACATAVNRVVNLTNRAIRLLPTPPNPDADHLCKLHCVLDYQNCYKYFVLVKMYKVINLTNNQYFSGRIGEFQTDHSHATRFRARGDLTLPFYRRTQCQRSFLYWGVKFWNELPEDLRSSPDVFNFKKQLKCYLIVNINQL
jgi:hypothetical protein